MLVHILLLPTFETVLALSTTPAARSTANNGALPDRVRAASLLS